LRYRPPWSDDHATAAALAAIYDRDFFAHYGATNPAYVRACRLNAAEIHRRFRPRTAVDWGCGAGFHAGALQRCGHARCEVVIGIRNGCGALADGPKRTAAAPGVTRGEAETKALRKCGADECRIVAWACTP